MIHWRYAGGSRVSDDTDRDEDEDISMEAGCSSITLRKLKYKGNMYWLVNNLKYEL